MPKQSSGVSGFLDNTLATIKSCVKQVVEKSAKINPANSATNQLIILGNGPSLRTNLNNDLDLLRSADTLAVNFAANTPEFSEIQPTYYLLADPHFFDKAGEDPNVGRLIENLNSITFPMTLFVPAGARKADSYFHNHNLTVKHFSFTAVEGYTWFENAMMNSHRGMPRPRNVLIPSIMVGIWLGYKEIYLLGADHSWLKTLSVNDRNEVVSIQPHFYKEDSREQQRVNEVYVNRQLHEVLESMMIAFKSYHRIREYADRCGTQIFNSTPGSMIDAFERASLPR
ncbi:MAG: hypothetical protein SO168_01250 [Muribaculaceae bacterium]|nr:hypothetical protein [Muribaculaceae bacterium]